MTTTIRRMQANDRSAWAAMRFRLWDQLPVEEHLLDIERMLGDNTRQGHMALATGVPVGFAEYSIRNYANGCTSQPVPFLEGIWVDRHYRRRGIGRALIDRITAELLGVGFKELCSDAGIRNWRSHHAHKEWGFAETDRVVCFRKPLTASPD